MRKPRFFKRDSTSVLLPQVRTLTLESLVSRYLVSGDLSGFEFSGVESFDFEDADHVDLDVPLPQNMSKIDAVLHFRNIADSMRAPLQAAPPKSVESELVAASAVESPAVSEPPADVAK